MDFSSFFDYPGVVSGAVEQEIIFLQQADKSDWQKLVTHCTRSAFAVGDTVIQQGDSTQAFYIVAKGVLEVVVQDEKRKVRQIATIIEGSVFGEQSFFDGAPRSASVRGLIAGELLELTLNEFEVLAAHEPRLAQSILFDLGRILSMRLRNTTRLALQN